MLLIAVTAPARAADKVDFAKQVRPIFAETCYKCHGPQKHKGDLRLDSVVAINKGGKDGAVLTPGNPDKSDLFHRITLPATDDDVMPPKDGPLPKEKIELVKQWIAEGANFGDWKADTAVASAGGGSSGASSDSGPPIEVLPQVPVADAGAVDKLRQAGATCLPLAQNTNLLEVSFPSGASAVTDETVALLAPIAQQVAELNLAGTKVTDKGLAALEKMTNLRRLHLEKTAVTDEGLAHLKGLTNLRYLNLYNTAVTDAGVAELTSLKSLRHLYLWQSKATDDGASKLKSALPNVVVDMGWKEPAK